jgi:hypothetical protein
MRRASICVILVARISLSAAAMLVAFIQTTYKFDGKSYPEYTQTNLADFAAVGATPNRNIYRLVDAYTVEIDRLDASGKVTATSRQSMSRDGKTLTATSATRPAQVWDKQ